MRNVVAKKDIRVIVEDYLGKKKAAETTDEIFQFIKKTSYHTHEGIPFFAYLGDNDEPVLNTEKEIKNIIITILKNRIEDENECLECSNAIIDKLHLLCSKKNYKDRIDTIICNLKNIEKFKVKGSYSKEYKELLKYEPKGENQKLFKNLLSKAIDSNIQDFEVPVCDPSMDENGIIQFIPGEKIITGFSCKEWERIAENNNIRIGTKSEYILFLGSIMNNLIKEGKEQDKVWEDICDDSKEIGHYLNSINAKFKFEKTGSRKVAGKCDLSNSYKVLVKDDDVHEFCIASGCFSICGNHAPIARISKPNIMKYPDSFCVGWMVL